MANEIVKYENRLNSIPLRRYNAREMNLFFSIASKVREKGTNIVVFTFEQLKELSHYTRHREQFIKDLDKTYEKLLLLNARTDDGHKITRFVAFTKYEIDTDNETVTIAVNPEFKGLFNELSNWTRFSLAQFASLKSTYSKTMFRLLKQWRTVGKLEISMEDFREKMDIPQSYRTVDIEARVMKYIREELPSFFKNLKVAKIRHGRGGKVTGYLFTFEPQAKDADDFYKGDDLTTPQKPKALKNLDKPSQRKRVETLPNWAKEDSKPTPTSTGLSEAELKELENQLAELEKRNSEK